MISCEHKINLFLFILHKCGPPYKNLWFCPSSFNYPIRKKPHFQRAKCTIRFYIINLEYMIWKRN